MVAVPELPDDPAGFVRCLAEGGYFEAVSFTADDRHRADQYAANAERAALRETTQSLDDYLNGLDMQIDFAPAAPVDMARVTQLVNKTNQFNTTTSRFTNQELSAFSAGSENMLLQFRLIDRFGDNGIVSVLMVGPVGKAPGALEIVNWVMSCRVFGRQLEDEIMNILVEMARDQGCNRIFASFVPTSRNGVIEDLFPRLGFSQLDDEPREEDLTRWALDLRSYSIRPTHITRKASQP